MLPQNMQCQRSKGRINSSMSSKMKRKYIGAHMEVNKQICAAATVSDEALLQLIHKKHASLSIINISTVFHRMARSKSCSASHGEDQCTPPAAVADWRFRALLCQAKEQLILSSVSEERARCMSMIAWSCAKLCVNDQQLMDIISELAGGCLNKFKPFELANLLWALLKMPLTTQNVQLFRKSFDHIHLTLEAYPLASLSMVAWIFTNAWLQGIIERHSCVTLLKKDVELFTRRMDPMPAGEMTPNPVTIENLLWSLATVHMHVEPAMLHTIGDAALRVLCDFKAYELSITLWAFARLGARHDRLFGAAASLLCESSHLRSKMHSQGIANIVWAFAKLESVAPQGKVPTSVSAAIRALLPTCKQLFANMKPQEFSSLLWAAAKLGQQWGKDHAMDELFLSTMHSINAHVDQKLLQKLSSHSVVNILRACKSYLGEDMLNEEPFRAFGEQLRGLAANSRGCAKGTGCDQDLGMSCLEDPCCAELAQLQLHPSSEDLWASCTNKQDVESIRVRELSSVFTEPSLMFQAMQPAYVEPSISDVQAPVIDIVHEATFQQDDGSVSITFEVNSTEVTKMYIVAVQIFHGDQLIDDFCLPVDIGYGIQNTHALKIAGLAIGSYEAHFILHEIPGEIVGEKTILAFDRQGDSDFDIAMSEYKVDPTKTKSCSDVSFTEDTVSTCTGTDNENQIFDGLAASIPSFHMGQQW